MTETSRDKFIRLAEKRVSRAINDIRLIGNLSDRSNYDFDDGQVGEIFMALRRELGVANKRFTANSKPKNAAPFRLGRRSKS